MLDREGELALVRSTNAGAPTIADPRVGIQKSSQGLYVLVINLFDIVVAEMTVFHS